MIEKDFDLNTQGGETFLDSPLCDKFVINDCATMNPETLCRLVDIKDYIGSYFLKHDIVQEREVFRIYKCIIEVDRTLAYGEIRWFKDGKEVK